MDLLLKRKLVKRIRIRHSTSTLTEKLIERIMRCSYDELHSLRAHGEICGACAYLNKGIKSQGTEMLLRCSFLHCLFTGNLHKQPNRRPLRTHAIVQGGVCSVNKRF